MILSIGMTTFGLLGERAAKAEAIKAATSAETAETPTLTYDPNKEVNAIIESLKEKLDASEPQPESSEPAKLVFRQKEQPADAKRPQVRLSEGAYLFIQDIRLRTGMTNTEIMDTIINYAKPNIVIEGAAQ